MARLIPFLLFEGSCAEAMVFYRSCFGGELTITRVGEMPAAERAPAESHDKVAYAHLQSGMVEFSATDWQHPTRQPLQGNTVALYVEGAFSELKEIFDRLAEGADRNLLDELRELSFGTYGHLADKFGVHWFFRGTTSPPEPT